MKQRTWMTGLIMIVLALLVVACGSSDSGDAAETVEGFAKNTDGYADISAEQLAELMEMKDITLVNVHIPYGGEIPQTNVFVPFDEIADHTEQLPGKDSPIVLYCRSGGMSTTAAEDLVSLGYSNVVEVDGGFNAWEASGFELLHNQ
jgi:rhodanese-related sulfurtransferase